MGTLADLFFSRTRRKSEMFKIVALVSALALLAFIAPAAAIPQGSLECEMCEYVVSFAENFVEENSTETEVENILSGICNILPFGGSECSALVAEYPELVQALLSYETPTVVCGEIGICSSSSSGGSSGLGAVVTPAAVPMFKISKKAM